MGNIRDRCRQLAVLSLLLNGARLQAASVPTLSFSGATGTTGMVGTAMSVSPTSFNVNGSSVRECSSVPALPSWAKLNKNTCVLTGTPTALLSSTTYNIRALNTAGYSSNAPLVLTVGAGTPRLSYVRATGTSAKVGAALSVAPTELNTRGSAITNCQVKASTTALPGWASLNTSTCVISGTPTTVANATYTIVATNAIGDSADATVTITTGANVPTLSYAGATGTTGFVGAAMIVTPTTLNLNGATQITRCVMRPQAGVAVPRWLSIDSQTCVLRGTPRESLSASYWVRASNSGGSSADASVTLSVVELDSIEVSSGDGQSGEASSALASPLVAIVKDSLGAPISGVVVDWTITGGGGSLGTPSGTTNASGLVSTSFTLGSSLGAQSARATVRSAPTLYVDFSATASDLTAPQVSAVAVQTGLTVDVTFSEAMGSGVTTAANYAVSGTGKGTLATNPNSVAFVSGNTYRLTWTSGEMVNGGNITITASTAEDLAGNAVNSSATHTGGAIGTAPTVTGLSNDTTPRQSKSWTWGCSESCTYRYAIDTSATWTASGSFGATTTDSQASGTNTYYVHVQASDAAGNLSTVVSVSAVIDNTAPAAASALGWAEGSSSSAGTINAQWTKSAAVDLYNQKIQFFADNSCSVTSGSLVDLVSNSLQTRAFTVSVSGNYTFKVTSFDEAGNSAVSACSSSIAMTVAFITAPYSLIASEGDNSISLSWLPATVSAGSITYSVLRGTSTGSHATTVVSGHSSTSYTDTSVSNGTTYYYVVVATNGSITSSESNEASITPADCPAAYQAVTSSTTYTVATACNAVYVKSWGAGGGGSGALSGGSGGDGGGGGYAGAMLSVSPSDSLTVTVATGGGGGASGNWSAGGGGGGSTGIVYSASPVVIAAGGGGGGANANASRLVHGDGGAGGGSSGVSGTTHDGGVGGGAGTSVAVGAGGTGAHGAGGSGSSGAGGVGGNPTGSGGGTGGAGYTTGGAGGPAFWAGGGGGGAGYFGGGGGGSGNMAGGGGGGGSSYFSGSVGELLSGSGRAPAKMSDAHYQGNYGSGGGPNKSGTTGTGTDGKNGLAVIYQSKFGATPQAPVIIDDGTDSTTVATPPITVSWDPGQGFMLDSYQLSLSTSSLGGTDVLGWTDVGAEPTFGKINLSLTNGVTYYPSVRARDVAGVVSASVTGDGFTARNTSCTTSPAVYSSAGSSTISVPAGCTHAVVKGWGGGGGGGGSNSGSAGGGNGGGAGFVGAVIPVFAGEDLSLTVAGGGGGGPGGYVYGGGGGGSTRLARSSTKLIEVSGGGAGGGTWAQDTSGHGGAGGALAGNFGSSCSHSEGGFPGTRNTAGVGGQGYVSSGSGYAASGSTGGRGGDDGTVGAFAVGGTGGAAGGRGGRTGSWIAGGGGGAGYYGGGGGGGGYYCGAGGGGGSSFSAFGIADMAGGSGSTAANSSDSNYASSAGAGGAGNINNVGTAGNPGRFVIIWGP